MKDTNSHFYSVHGLLKFVVIDHKGYGNRIFDSFNKHYTNFSTECDFEECDMTIEIGKFIPQLDNSYNVGDGNYYFREDYMYISQEYYKGAKWSFEIEGLNSPKTNVKVDCNLLGRIFISGNVIDFLIHLKLLQKNCTIIHASAVSKGENAFIFASRGGGGKTTIALELVTKGFSFLGDNYAIVHKDTVLSFPTSLSIFTYNLSPIIYQNISRKERKELRIKRIIYNITKGYAKFFTKINPKEIFEDFKLSAPLQTAYLILPTTDSLNGQIIVEKINMDNFVSHMRYNMSLEFPFFNRYIKEYSYFFPEKELSLHWEKYSQCLKDNLPKDINYTKIIVPSTYNAQIFSQIMEEIYNEA